MKEAINDTNALICGYSEEIATIGKSQNGKTFTKLSKTKWYANPIKLDLRIWYKDSSLSEYIPTKKGLTISLDEARILKDALEKVLGEETANAKESAAES